MNNQNEKSTQTTVARINNVEIIVIENGEKRVAIKPIWDALGIASNGQIEKIKNDEILSSTYKLSLSVGADGKERNLQTIPFKFVFGWLFTINPKNVATEAKEAIIKFKLECYNALYNHFTGYAEFIEQKEQLIERQLEIVETARTNFKNTKSVLDEANAALKTIRQLTYSDYDAERRQLRMFTNEQMEG